MISIQLDAAHMKLLDELATIHGEDATEMARQIVVNFIDLRDQSTVSDEEWAEASVALAPEFVDDESWDNLDHGL